MNRVWARRGEDGFTLIELSVSMVIFSVLLAVSIGGFTKYRNAQDERGTAVQIEEVLRNAQSRAQAEGLNYCVSFDVATRGWSVYRSTCSTGTLVVTGKTRTLGCCSPRRASSRRTGARRRTPSSHPGELRPQDPSR